MKLLTKSFYNKDLSVIAPFLGKILYDSEEREVGVFVDVLVDATCDRALYAIVAVGGAAGAGARMTPIPCRALQSFGSGLSSRYIIDRPIESIFDAPTLTSLKDVSSIDVDEIDWFFFPNESRLSSDTDVDLEASQFKMDTSSIFIPDKLEMENSEETKNGADENSDEK